ncbi:MAG: MBL fold metallo-hydrolase [Polyangia bacterium]
MSLEIETIVNGPFQENCYLAWDSETRAGAFFDPGSEPDKLIRTARFLEVEVKAIFNTHGHIDHAGAAARVREELGVPFAIHPADAFLLEGMPDQARMFGIEPMEVPPIDRELAHEAEIEIGGHCGRVLHTPGHTPGGVCFSFDELVIAGDTLFAGSIGRSDLPGGSHRQLLESIRRRLLQLPNDRRVFCGHGPPTTIGRERRHNPFIS